MRATAVKEKLKEICMRYHVRLLYAYGSRCQEVKNLIEEDRIAAATPQSDVDIGVMVSGNHPLTVKNKVHLAMELEDLFDVNRVDLAVLSEVDPFVVANIIRGERLYCVDEYEADEYDLYVLRRAGDLAPLERERLKIILGEDSV